MRRGILCVEGGGTSWVAAILPVDDVSLSCDKGWFDLLEQENRSALKDFRVEFPTTTPDETLSKVRNWMRTHMSITNVETTEEVWEILSVGVCTFGPVDAVAGSSTFGFITSTPKPGWQQTDVLRGLGAYDEFSKIPFAFDTDVNAPALSEFATATTLSSDKPLENERPLTSYAYVTVGGGIGVGLVANSQPVHGLVHPEAGHLPVRIHPEDLPFAVRAIEAEEEVKKLNSSASDEEVAIARKKVSETKFGWCPYHGACLEGLCSAGALACRAKVPREQLAELSDEDPLWQRFAYYIAQLVLNLLLVSSPQRIALGGGVFRRKKLLAAVQAEFLQLLNGYVQHRMLTTAGVHDFIVVPHWGDSAGMVGAGYLGLRLLRK